MSLNLTQSSVLMIRFPCSCRRSFLSSLVKEQHVLVVVWDTIHVKMFALYQHIGEDIVNTTGSALTKFNFRDLHLIQYSATFNNRDNNKNTTCIIIRLEKYVRCVLWLYKWDWRVFFLG